jgi:heme exporter protein C
MYAKQSVGLPTSSSVWLASGAASAMLCLAMTLIFLVAPREATMGEVQRIVYLHVAMAWCSLVSIIVVGGCGAGYLYRRDLRWDCWAQAAAEVGWLCNLLTLVTGSLWAHEAWNTWWTWEPRLTTTLILWIIFSGNLLLRCNLKEPHLRARLGSVLGLLGLADVPLIVMATRWFRGMHPVAPEMDATMRGTLLFSALSFALFFALLVIWRRHQVALAIRLDGLERNHLTTIQETHG